MLQKAIGKRVMELRIVKFDWSQEQLTDRLGWDRTFISRVETGQQNTTIQKLNELCNGLDVTLKDFFLLLIRLLSKKRRMTNNGKDCD